MIFRQLLNAQTLEFFLYRQVSMSSNKLFLAVVIIALLLILCTSKRDPRISVFKTSRRHTCVGPNSNKNLNIFIVFHKRADHTLSTHDSLYHTLFAVNPSIVKEIDPSMSGFDIVHEYNLTWFEPLFQECGYNEASAIVHVGMNQLHQNLKFIGFSQYDIRLPETQSLVQKETCLYASAGFNIMEEPVFPHLLFFDAYNKWFKTKFTISDLKRISSMKFNSSQPQIPLLSTFVIPVEAYEILYPFWLSFMYDLFIPCKVITTNKIPKHHRHVAGIMERVFGASLVLCDTILKFRLMGMEGLGTKSINYDSKGDGDGYETASEVIDKWHNILKTREST